MSSPRPGSDPADVLERRLARLRFDLHDGPQQQVHLLAQDLRLFREQLAASIAGHADRARVLGRLDDLEAQLISLDGDLRRLTTSTRSPLAEPSPVQALTDVAATFTARTGIVPAIEISGEIESLTDSQQIALLSLVREALSNVRRHSGADHVTIALRASSDEIAVQVADDGRGFTPQTAGEAARDGHLGLVGMRERMRMLGGSTEITSAPGGPTTVSATLPRWPAAPVA